jgi:hypothetical protein
MNLLSNKQKAEICQLAHEAWEARADIREPLLECNLATMSKTAIFEAWRHVEQGKAVGRQSLTKCTSEGDFLKLCAHFRAMIPGQEQRAARTLARHAAEPRLVAMHKLRQACSAAGLELGYAAAICRTQNKCTLDEASEKQLWRLVFTVKNRSKAKRPQYAAAAAANADDPF